MAPLAERSIRSGRRGSQRVATVRRVPASTPVLRRLIAQGNGTGIDTSAGLLFNHTIWGRDRAMTALDVLPEL